MWKKGNCTRLTQEFCVKIKVEDRTHNLTLASAILHGRWGEKTPNAWATEAGRTNRLLPHLTSTAHVDHQLRCGSEACSVWWEVRCGCQECLLATGAVGDKRGRQQQTLSKVCIPAGEDCVMRTTRPPAGVFGPFGPEVHLGVSERVSPKIGVCLEVSREVLFGPFKKWLKSVQF